MTLRPYLVPYGLGIGLIGLAYGFATLLHGAAGLWGLLAAFLGFPLIVAGFERDRLPDGRWWIAPLVALAVSLLIFAGFLFYVLSRI